MELKAHRRAGLYVAHACQQERRQNFLIRKPRANPSGDFLEQLQQIKKMGSLSQLMGMIPGVDRLMKGKEIDDKPLRQVEAVISSMTLHERENPDVLNGSRRKRIASGSGTSIQDVNRVIKQFYDMQKMIKTFKKGRGMNNMLRNMGLPPNFSLK